MALKKRKIKIPASKIYYEQNSKVIDNQIDKIEVKQNVASIISDTQNVYNETVKSGFDDNYTPQKDTQTFVGAYGNVSQNRNYYWVNIAYAEVTPTYVTKTIIIPKQIRNSSISRIFTGADDNGNPNIKYSIRGEKKFGVAVGSIKILSVSTGLGGETLHYENVIVDKPTNITKLENTTYTISKEEIDISYESPLTINTSPQKDASVTAKIKLTDESNILEAKVTPTKDGKNYETTLKILSGIKINKLKGSKDIDESNIKNYILQLLGEYEEYIPTQVDISFYGDTISLDLKEETISVGTGKNVYSMESNELIQSTNTPSNEEKYQEIIDTWKNGKEVATLRCAIDDYFEVDENIVITIQSQYSENEVVIYSDYALNIDDVVRLKNGNRLTVVRSSGLNNYWVCRIETNEFTMDEQTAFLEGKKLISKRGESEYPMLFQNGDIVVPYNYVQNGREKPMSLAVDGTEKSFEVLGTNIIYDGAIWQELSVREYLNKTVIKIVGETSGAGDIVYMEYSYVSGQKLKEDDIISYQGKTAEITGAKELRCEKGDIFTKQEGKTITVEIVE